MCVQHSENEKCLVDTPSLQLSIKVLTQFGVRKTLKIERFICFLCTSL